VRIQTLGASIAAHALLGIVLVSLATHDRPAPRATMTIELVDIAPPPPPVVGTSETGESSGGSSGTVQVASAAPPRAARVASGVRRDARAPRSDTFDDVTLEDLRDEIRIEDRNASDGPRGEAGIDAGFVGEGARGDGSNYGDGGRGDGRGQGAGRGIGLGDGARIADAPVALETPAPPKASKARVAKLVYPVRQRQVDDSELFVARVTIDDEGFVVGAKLVRGFGGPRDVMAADLIWKFRYAPALDDAGTPIRSTFDQRFLVGR
jgi:hypothetical protein